MAKIFLVQSTNLALRIGEAVITFHKQITPLASDADRRLCRIEVAGACKSKAEGFVLDATCQTFGIRFQNMGGRCSLDGNGKPALSVNIDG